MIMMNFQDSSRDYMTVKELLDAATFCDLAEIVIRNSGRGRWIQGYRIGKDAKIYPSEVTAEIQEARGLKVEYTTHTISLKENEIVDIDHAGIIDKIPMRVICKDCRKGLPKELWNLKVCDFQPRHIPTFHKEQLTHNDFALEINCYPLEEASVIEVKEVEDVIDEKEIITIEER